MSNFLHKDLSYKVRGIFFDVHNALGPNLPESFYEDAAAVGFEDEGVTCETQKGFTVNYRGVQVGQYYVDMWVENGKILLELKAQPTILPLHLAQAINYLKVTKADLAMVVNFGEELLRIERLPNFLGDQKGEFFWQPDMLASDILYPALTNGLLKALHSVHYELQPGFFHHVYRRATMVELRDMGIVYEYIKEIPIYFRNRHLGFQPARLIYVEGKVLLATIAVQEMDASYERQLLARMKHVGTKLGILANFNGKKLDVRFLRLG